MSVTTLKLLLVLNLAVIGYVGYLTYYSEFIKRHRRNVYIMLLISPVIGAILFVVYQRKYYKITQE